MQTTETSPTLLLVDDDGALRCLVDAVTAPLGFKLDWADSGDKALQKLRTQTYSVVLLDLMLPRVNGFEVLRELKAVRPDLLSRVIVLTAAADHTLRNFDASSTPVWKLMRKPFELSDFVSAVSDCAQANLQSPQPPPQSLSAG